MKLATSVLALSFVLAQQAYAAPTVAFTAGGTTVSGTVIQNFEGLNPGDAIGPNAFAHGGSSGSAARPAYGSTGNFGSVHAGGAYTINFGATSALSFVLGSLDSYNSLTLKLADGTSALYSGSAISGGGQADGNQTSPATNGVVKFSAGSGPLITGATFNSSQDSFEFDNIAVGVPEPATWALMILGFGLVGVAMRRRSSQVAWMQAA